MYIKGFKEKYWPYVKPLLLLLVGLLAARIIIGLIGSIDWAAVWNSITLLPIASIALLLGLLALRQSFNAIPLTRFVAGLTLGRSVQNDLSAFVIGTVAPPPSDVVLRVSMFRSWRIDPIEGMAGVTLNVLTFYVVRFAAPLIGVVLLIFGEISRGQVWLALGSGLVALVILVGLISISRGDRLAHLIGYTSGKIARRFKSTVQPQKWADAVVDFRGLVGDRVKSGIAPSLGALIAMVLTDSLMVLVALRAVGVSNADLPVIEVIGAFMLLYPLTLFPLAGFGLLDASLIAVWVGITGTDFEPQLVAALIIWRVFSLLVPLAAGGGTLLLWRRSVRKSGQDQDQDQGSGTSAE